MNMIRPRMNLPVALLGLGAILVVSTVAAQAASTNKYGTNTTAPPAATAPAPASEPAPQRASGPSLDSGKRTHTHGTNSNMPPPASPETEARQ